VGWQHLLHNVSWLATALCCKPLMTQEVHIG
jgi:hypothetical protein